MTSAAKIVISSSRRTDIPAFYMGWFMEQIRQGAFEVVNPYNRRVSRVCATPETVHTIVFWSKNFGPFLHGGYGETLQDMGYHLFFNFTVNSESAVLEPNVPPLKERLDQMETLCRHFDARAISWRFDPICFYRKRNGKIEDNLADFSLIADKASQCGVRRCITSFMDDYPKIRKRTAALPCFSFVDPAPETKKNIILKLKKEMDNRGIRLSTCCEKDLLKTLPPDSGVANSSCVPNDLIVEIFGGTLCLKKDAGQRIKDGCGCMVSVDIGSYSLHPCFHNCLFCYANPSGIHSRSPISG